MTVPRIVTAPNNTSMALLFLVYTNHVGCFSGPGATKEFSKQDLLPSTESMAVGLGIHGFRTNKRA
jgi:hypothetical protein